MDSESGSGGEYGGEDEDSIVSDKALKVAERISKLYRLSRWNLGYRSGLKQVLLSLNIGIDAIQLMNNEIKLGLMLEKKILDIIKE